MNIGFLYGQTFPPGTGGSVHGYQLAKGLAERGHKLRSWYYGSDSNPYITHYRGRQVAAFLRRIDVLYVRTRWEARSTFVWLRRLAFRRLPVVWELNGVPEEILHLPGKRDDLARVNDALRRLAHGVNAGIGVTAEVCRYLNETLGINIVQCIPNGSDPKLFTPPKGRSDQSKPLRIVWIGSISCPWHDIRALLAAAETLARKNSNVQFEIYGRREALPENLPDNVRCRGTVPYSEVGTQLREGDVGVHLFKAINGKLIDGSPLKLFDYMASGLAVIAQDSGQTGRVVAEQECGVFTTGHPDDLAEKVLQLDGDRDFCHRLGQNGRRAVEEYYNWGRVAEETERVLLAALNG